MGLPNRHRQNYNNVGRGLMVQVRDFSSSDHYVAKRVANPIINNGRKLCST